MNRKLAAASIIIFVGMLCLSFKVQRVEAIGTIYIRADGSIDPPTAPIYTADNITYTLTGNITSDADGVVVERSNVVVDGVGYTLQGAKASDSSGIVLGRLSNNVTIKNMKIRAFYNGIKIDESMNNSIYANDIVDNVYSGIPLFSWDIYSSYNRIFTNNIRNNFCGISVGLGSVAMNNSIYENNITDNDCGIYVSNGFNNTIYGNNIRNNSEFGIRLECTDNYIHHNNFDNAQQVHWQSITNIFDNGYPSGGNYWSDYNGTDANHDGIGDTAYIIDANNTDHYPLMTPYIIPEFPIFFILPLFMIATLPVVLVYRRKHAQRE